MSVSAGTRAYMPKLHILFGHIITPPVLSDCKTDGAIKFSDFLTFYLMNYENIPGKFCCLFRV